MERQFRAAFQQDSSRHLRREVAVELKGSNAWHRGLKAAALGRFGSRPSGEGQR